MEQAQIDLGVHWETVAEIETYMYLNRFEEDGFLINHFLNKERLLAKSKPYNYEQIIEYFQRKYPNFSRLKYESTLRRIYNESKYERVQVADQRLLELSYFQNPYEKEEFLKRLDVLEMFCEKNGIIVFFYNILREVIQEFNYYDEKDICAAFLGELNFHIKKDTGNDLWKILNNQICDIDKFPLIIIEENQTNLFDLFYRVKERIQNFRDQADISVYEKMYNIHGYPFPYPEGTDYLFFQDCISFSINECLVRLFSRSKKPVEAFMRWNVKFPKDFEQTTLFGDVWMYITPYYLYHRKGLDDYHLSNELSSPSLLPGKYTEVDVLSLSNYMEMPVNFEYNTGLIFGRDLVYAGVEDSYSGKSGRKLMNGTFWFFPETYGPSFRYLQLDSFWNKGEKQELIHADDWLLNYSEIHLEKVKWDWPKEDLESFGYRVFP